eukprot:TRINITY_DN6475_c0_g1_i2.p1 TRINITY_DN6475_c0_g1~~TRINITY_DN6475_c0_g1_i2.p1  ORF type:complete len:384 (-),score=63.26 TRINITY_DN6475_c0_g1_i2:103-1254(-)
MNSSGQLKGRFIGVDEEPESDKYHVWKVFQYSLELPQKLIILGLGLQILLYGVIFLIFLSSKVPKDPETFFFLASFAIVFVTQYYFAYEAILKANPYEFSAFLLLSFLTWIGLMFKSISFYSMLRFHRQDDTWIGSGTLIINGLLTIIQIGYVYFSNQSYIDLVRRLHKRLGASPKFHETYKNFEIFRSINRMVGSVASMQYFVILYLDTKTSYQFLYQCLDLVFFGLAVSVIYLGHEGAVKRYGSFIVSSVFGASFHLSYRLARFVLFLNSLPEWHVAYYSPLQRLAKTRVNLLVAAITVEIVALGIYMMMVVYGRKIMLDFTTEAYDKIVQTNHEWKKEVLSPKNIPTTTLPLVAQSSMFSMDNSFNAGNERLSEGMIRDL